MENTHLFSSMVIMSLAMAIDTRCPDTFTIEPDDAVLYQGGKCIIYEMIQAGSVPAKGFEKMLRDVEELGGRISHKRSSPDRVDVMKWDDEEWVTQLLLDAENGLDGS